MNDSNIVRRAVAEIWKASTPIITITSLGGARWRRDVAKGARIGPWLPAQYRILNERARKAPGPCLYLVAGADDGIRYVGISRNGLSHRWRLSPAIDAQTLLRMDTNQLFHSQCWKHIEREYAANPRAAFEVRRIDPDALIPVLERMGPPAAAFAALRASGESVVAAVERWICNHSGPDLANWNVAMTSRPGLNLNTEGRAQELPQQREMPALTEPANAVRESSPAQSYVSGSSAAASRDIRLTGPMLRNGRLYFSYSDKTFFPADSLGERSGGEGKGRNVTIIANGVEYESDIRLSSGQRISPRRSFAGFLQSVKAKEGDRVRLTRVDERVYRLEFIR